MQDYQLLIDLHRDANRQGPGGETETMMAIELSKIDRELPLKIADIGCGTGASTLVLAQELNAQITAIDFLQDFLNVLERRADQAGLSEKISTLACSMDDLPFEDSQWDVIWSEGAIYNIGFQKGVADWKRYLKVDGILVVSEITWITASRPAKIQQYWEGEYPEIDTASAKLKILEMNGYAPMGYFVLPKHCWLENYYRPIQQRLDDFRERHGNSIESQAIVDAEKQEIALYENYSDYYSYGVYVARKLA